MLDPQTDCLQSYGRNRPISPQKVGEEELTIADANGLPTAWRAVKTGYRGVDRTVTAWLLPSAACFEAKQFFQYYDPAHGNKQVSSTLIETTKLVIARPNPAALEPDPDLQETKPSDVEKEMHVWKLRHGSVPLDDATISASLESALKRRAASWANLDAIYDSHRLQ